MTPRPYVWTVYPAHSGDPMVATGAHDDEEKARQVVESVLGCADDSAFGVIVSPDLRQDVCRRNGDGGFAWRPLFPGGWPARDEAATDAAPSTER